MSLLNRTPGADSSGGQSAYDPNDPFTAFAQSSSGRRYDSNDLAIIKRARQITNPDGSVSFRLDFNQDNLKLAKAQNAFWDPTQGPNETGIGDKRLSFRDGNNNEIYAQDNGDGTKGFDISHLGDKYAELGQDFSNFNKRNQANSADYAAYLEAMKNSPGREGTVLAGEGSAPTILGTTKQTVLG